MLAFRDGEVMRKSLLFFISLIIVVAVGHAKAAEPIDSSIWDNFNLGGYSSVGVNVHPGGKTDGAVNEISLIVSWENSSRFRFFTELELERPLSFNDDHTVVGKNFYFDLERLYVDYNLSEKVNLRAGRFLNPTGRWNLLHAAPLVWTSSRPLATSRLFPLFSNGLMFYGAVPLTGNALEYSVFAEVLKDQDNDKGEIPFEDTKGVRLNLSGKVNWGISLMEFSEKIPSNVKFHMVGLDFLVKHEDWEFSGEAFQRYSNKDNDSGNGAYLQGIAPLGNRWFAVARVESFKHPVEGSSERWLLGTAWRMTPSRILKIEYVAGDEERAESPKGLLASFAILF